MSGNFATDRMRSLKAACGEIVRIFFKLAV